MMQPPLAKKFPAAQWFHLALLALALLAPAVAQAEAQRWLFIIDTSSAMKKRLPAVETALMTLLTKDFVPGLHAGDSIGVWTFNGQLQMGKYPLITWNPAQAVQTASNLVTFVHKQSFSGTTTFSTLQPTLNSVIEDSERLTMIIFCDGDDEINLTPYDDGINGTIQQMRDERAKSRQPYVVVLRTQLAKYIGATVNFPPQTANLPPFPLLPREIKTLPPVVVITPPPPPAQPPLIIVGTHVSSDTNDITKYSVAPATPPPGAPTAPTVVSAPAPFIPPAATAPPVTTPQPIVTAPPVVTPAPNETAPSVATTPSVAPAASAPSAPASTPTVAASVNPAPAPNSVAVVATVTGDDRDTRILTYVGVGLLGAAVVLVFFLIFHSRSPARGSLITSSMQGAPRPPEKK